MKRRAFTLVELLVVIGIISVLIAILMPALANARRAAQVVQCASNMRQVGQAFYGYTSDYNDCLPFAVFWDNVNGNHYGWDAALDPFLGGSCTTGPGITDARPTSTAIEQCPADTLEMSSHGWDGAARRSYSMPSQSNDSSVSDGGVGYFFQYNVPNDGGYAPNYNKSCKLSQVQQPTRQLLLVECHANFSGSTNEEFQQENYVQILPPSWNQTDPAWYTYAPHGQNGGKNGVPDAKWNWLFCDGHVEFLPRSATESHYFGLSGWGGMWTLNVND